MPAVARAVCRPLKPASMVSASACDSNADTINSQARVNDSRTSPGMTDLAVRASATLVLAVMSCARSFFDSSEAAEYFFRTSSTFALATHNSAFDPSSELWASASCDSKTPLDFCSSLYFAREASSSAACTFLLARSASRSARAAASFSLRPCASFVRSTSAICALPASAAVLARRSLIFSFSAARTPLTRPVSSSSARALLNFDCSTTAWAASLSLASFSCSSSSSTSCNCSRRSSASSLAASSSELTFSSSSRLSRRVCKAIRIRSDVLASSSVSFSLPPASVVCAAEPSFTAASSGAPEALPLSAEPVASSSLSSALSLPWPTTFLLCISACCCRRAAFKRGVFSALTSDRTIRFGGPFSSSSEDIFALGSL
mmetsp:Transcript_69902/g.120974  ORF Transcript_69902/g.120974 Transcript_69902/m.120974 type:complete len:375 (-) Transcript_69902:49-1173(-)